MLKNWKTSLAGLSAILTAVGDIAHSLSTNTPISWNVDVAAITGGIGLLLAKDSTTHSTVAEVQISTAKDHLAADLAANQTQKPQ
jgi:hypothetical protein